MRATTEAAVGRREGKVEVAGYGMSCGGVDSACRRARVAPRELGGKHALSGAALLRLAVVAAAVGVAVICAVLPHGAHCASDAPAIDTSFYHSTTELQELLTDLSNSYPNLASLHSLGTSIDGKDLWYMRIASEKATDDQAILRPMMKWVGNMHGNEAVGRQVLIYYIQYLLHNYGDDERVTRLVDSTEIFIMPTMNPDGFETAMGHKQCRGIHGRGNAHNYDLNRNFPEQFLDSNRKARQKETKLLMDWIKSNPFVLSANLHGGSLVASYPFDSNKPGRSDYSRSPDDDVFHHLARTYADNHETMHTFENTPCEIGDENEFDHGITNGADWYSLTGGMQDFNYLHSNCFEITVELSCCKFPAPEKLSTEWLNNQPALLAYTEQVHMGVKGLVRDAASGSPLPSVAVGVAGRDHDVSTTAYGAYWRLLLPGNYTLVFTAEGYEEKRVRVSVPHTEEDASPEAVVQNVELWAAGTGPGDGGDGGSDDDDGDGDGDENVIDLSTDAINAKLRDVVEISPRSARVFTLSVATAQGQAIKGVEISHEVDNAESDRPRVGLFAGLHANEAGGTYMLLQLAQKLLTTQDPDVAALLQNVVVQIVPRVNNDAFQSAVYGNCFGEEGSLNANDVDLLRDTRSDFQGSDSSQPETKALLLWVKQERLALTAYFGAGAYGVTWPFSRAPKHDGEASNPAPEGLLLQRLARAYAQGFASFSPVLAPMSRGLPCANSDPKARFSSDDERPVIIGGSMNGYALLSSTEEVSPSASFFGDVVYDRFGTLHLDVFVGCCLFPTTDELTAIADAAFNPTRDLAAAAASALVGHVVRKSVVVGADPSPIVGATVEISAVDTRSTTGTAHRPPATTAGDGRFVRLLSPGSYKLRVSAPGFEPQAQVLDITESAAAASYTFELSPSPPSPPPTQGTASAPSTTTTATTTGGPTEPVASATVPRELPATPPGYALKFQGLTPFNDGAPLRFSSAFESDRRIGDVLVVVELADCAEACGRQDFCRGFMVYRQEKKLRCSVLSDLGDDRGVSTSLFALSYARTGHNTAAITTSIGTATSGSTRSGTRTPSDETTATTTMTTTTAAKEDTTFSTRPPPMTFDTSVHPHSTTAPATPHFTAPPPPDTTATKQQQGGSDDDDAGDGGDDVPELDDLDCPLSLAFEHHDESAVHTFFREAAKFFPNLSSLSSIGESVEGRTVWALQISDKPGEIEAGEPFMYYAANIHGNEVVGREISLHFVRLLLCGYDVSARIRRLVDSTVLLIVPSLNPDGYATAAANPSRSHCTDNNDGGVVGRNNAHDVDLNRNFPDQYQTQRQPDRQRETEVIMDFAQSYPFVLSANLHGGSLVASYPFDGTPTGAFGYSAAPDDKTFKRLAKAYSHNHRKMSTTPCRRGEHFKDGITNGADWYPLYGGAQDWMYLHTNNMEITIELSCCKFPKAAELQSYWGDNKMALLAYAEKVHTGVKGFVYDAESKKPLPNVNISVQGNSKTVRSVHHGAYWRLLAPGTYFITASGPGYKPATQTITVRSFAAFSAAEHDFHLQRADDYQKYKHNYDHVVLDGSSSSGGGGGGDKGYSFQVQVGVAIIFVLVVVLIVVFAAVKIKQRWHTYRAVKDAAANTKVRFSRLTEEDGAFLISSDDDSEEEALTV